jgi:hypothetical protein
VGKRTKSAGDQILFSLTVCIVVYHLFSLEQIDQTKETNYLPLKRNIHSHYFSFFKFKLITREKLRVGGLAKQHPHFRCLISNYCLVTCEDRCHSVTQSPPVQSFSRSLHTVQYRWREKHPANSLANNYRGWRALANHRSRYSSVSFGFPLQPFMTRP